MEKNKLTNNDLKNNKYDMRTLEENIDNLELDVILSTQTLTIDFIVDFILDENNQKTTKEKDIDLHTILCDQPHISKEELFKRFNLT